MNFNQRSSLLQAPNQPLLSRSPSSFHVSLSVWLTVWNYCLSEEAQAWELSAWRAQSPADLPVKS